MILTLLSLLDPDRAGWLRERSGRLRVSSRAIAERRSSAFPLRASSGVAR
jgi:hypothetical protein